jgi:hypothetical protein
MRQNNIFKIKLRVFEFNFIYIAFLILYLLISIIQKYIYIIAKNKFKGIIIKPFNIFIASIYNKAIDIPNRKKMTLKSFWIQ